MTNLQHIHITVISTLSDTSGAKYEAFCTSFSLETESRREHQVRLTDISHPYNITTLR